MTTKYHQDTQHSSYNRKSYEKLIILCNKVLKAFSIEELPFKISGWNSCELYFVRLRTIVFASQDKSESSLSTNWLFKLCPLLPSAALPLHCSLLYKLCPLNQLNIPSCQELFMFKIRVVSFGSDQFGLVGRIIDNVKVARVMLMGLLICPES